MGTIPANEKVHVPALEKGLSALECVNASAMPMSLTEISRACGYSVSEMQRVIPCLAANGYFLRDSRGLYRASSKLFRIANQHPPFRELVANAMPAMRMFASETGEGVHLSVMESGGLLIVADVPGTGYVRIGVRIGSVHEPAKTASGRVLLAFGNNGDASAYKEIARQGYEFTPSHLLKGVQDLAVPVRGRDGTVIGALATSWLDRVDEEKRLEGDILEALQKCAESISKMFEP
jgi:DNA-binding IclR family transcriptional regulator